MSEQAREKLVSDVKEVIRDVELLMKETADGVGEKAAEVRDRLTKTVDSLKSQLGEVEKAVRSNAAAGVRETDKVIRNHPYESIGLSFGIGLLVGFMIGRR